MSDLSEFRLPIPVERTAVELMPDRRRVIVRPFISGAQLDPHDGLVGRVLALSDEQVAATLASAYAAFVDRHTDLAAVLEEHFQFIAQGTVDLPELSADRRRLIGAYYTQEHAIEAAALTNPSIVVGPDQSGLAHGSTRFVMSLRAIGEGHLSSIEFRSVQIDRLGNFAIDPPSGHAQTGTHESVVLDKADFTEKLETMGALDSATVAVVDQLPDAFEIDHLEAALAASEGPAAACRATTPTTRAMHWLAKSNYELTFPPTSKLDERVIFPWQAVESHGPEDARFVRFTDDDGSTTYYATYTAYDGFRVLPQLIETEDFLTFHVGTLGGAGAANKGAALFPRKINGRYVALSRYDAENSYVMFSDTVQEWPTADLIETPSAPWQLARVGNCGSPLETERGWLVITHGVGPFRVYSLGAILLDIDDPRRVIGHLSEPLITAPEADRDGYVPNVVYSCGGVINGNDLILPYGISDATCRIARIPLAPLLDNLTYRSSVPPRLDHTARAIPAPLLARCSDEPALRNVRD
jgi:predicted GH43/DUF377 family glycosyl hydrolase